MTDIVARNRVICDSYAAGERPRTIARAHGLTHRRVYEILFTGPAEQRGQLRAANAAALRARAEAMCAEYRKRRSLNVVGKLFGLSGSRVCQIINEIDPGITSRPAPPPSVLERNQAIVRDYASGLSLTTVARLWAMSPETVRTIVRKADESLIRPALQPAALEILRKQQLQPSSPFAVQLDRLASHYQALAIRPTTLAGYELYWRQFTEFCAPADPWRATHKDVARWITSLGGAGMSYATLRTRCAGLRCHFEVLGEGHAAGRTGTGTRRSPTQHPVVRRILKGIRRYRRELPNRKQPVLLDTLEAMIDHWPDDIFGLRNRAAYALAWSACRRPQEVLSLDIRPGGDGQGWVEIDEDGLTVVLLRSKTRQEYDEIERYGIPRRPNRPQHCAVALVERWLAAAGHSDGRLIRALRRNGTVEDRGWSGERYRTVLKEAAAALGLDPANISGHSLRAGCITWLYLEGVDPVRIRSQSGQKNVETVLKYVRPFAGPNNSPLLQTRWR